MYKEVAETGKIKVLLVDDHVILREGLRRILNNEDDMVVVGEAATGRDAIEKAKQLKPDVVLLDVSLPDHNGVQVLARILDSVQTRVIMLSMHCEGSVISKAITSGASGYFGKEAADAELVHGIRTVMRSATVFSAAASRILANPYPDTSERAGRSVDTLSVREREVFNHLADGQTPTEIAKILSLSAKTVHTHRQHIMEKLGLKRTVDLIRLALRRGFIPAERDIDSN